jgi:site-specific DNA-cytosine methylase
MLSALEDPALSTVCDFSFIMIRKYFPDMPEKEIQQLAKDGPRYKACGNAFAVPVVRWIAKRLIAEIERID